MSLQQLPLGRPSADMAVARGYAFDAGLLFPVRPSAVLALGAGDLVASARDVAALAAAIVNERLLAAESAREMLVPYTPYDAAAYACPETGRSAALLANTSTALLKNQVRAVLVPRHCAQFPQP